MGREGDDGASPRPNPFLWSGAVMRAMNRPRLRTNARGATWFGILIALLLIGIAAYMWFDIFGPQITPTATIWFELMVIAILATLGGVAVLVGIKL